MGKNLQNWAIPTEVPYVNIKMLNFVINNSMYHGCEVSVIFCQSYTMFSGN